jgi:TonB family protein
MRAWGRIARSAAASLACCMVAIAKEAAPAIPTVTTAELKLSSPEELAKCFAPAALASYSDNKFLVRMAIEPDGSATDIRFPDGMETWQEKSARCVVEQLKFRPMIKDGVAVRSEVTVPVNLDLALPDEVKPPTTVANSGKNVGHCYDLSARRSGNEGHVNVKAIVGTDGRVSEYSLPPGIDAWQERTARCVLAELQYAPAQYKGVPIPAAVAIPIHFVLEGSLNFTNIKLVSGEVEIEEAYRACYPPDQLAVAEPQYRVTVDKSGKVDEVTLVASAGDAGLDEAGACVLKRLTFEPARRGGMRTSTTVVMPIPLRPPQ